MPIKFKLQYVDGIRLPATRWTSSSSQSTTSGSNERPVLCEDAGRLGILTARPHGLAC